MTNPNEVGVFNPLSTDFSCNYDDGNGVKGYTVRSREPAYFLPAIAKHIKKHLYDAIVNHRGLNGIELNADLDKKSAILEEMEVNL